MVKSGHAVTSRQSPRPMLINEVTIDAQSELGQCRGVDILQGSDWSGAITR